MCIQRTGAHPARHPSGFSSARSPRHRGPRLGGILPQKQLLAALAPGQSFYVRERSQRRSAGMHGFVDKTGSVRGAEHRRVRRKKPVGARAGSARVGCEHRDVLSDDPAVPEKRRVVRFARCESDRRVRCLAFLVTFWAMPKSNRLARRARRTLCTSKKQHRAKSWIPAFAGMTSFRAFAATAGVGTAAIRKEATK